MNTRILLAMILAVSFGLLEGAAWSGEDGLVFEKAGPNLLPGGDFENGALAKHWTVDNNRGAFSVKKVPGRKGGTAGSAAALVSTGTKGRGKFHVSGIRAPLGAAVRVRLWAKAEGLAGGAWVTLEGKGAARGQEFFLAGGTHDWLRYEYRTTIAPKKGGTKGRNVPLSLWMYVYGQGTLVLDDVEFRVIQPDPAAKAAWAERRAGNIVKEAASWRGKKPVGIGALAAQAKGAKALAGLDTLIRACGRAVSGSKDWGVLVTDPLRRVLRDVPFRGAFAPSVEIELARHEFEGAQVLIFAHGQDLKNVSVSLSDLAGPGAFPAKNVQVLPVAYGDRSKAPPIPWYTGSSSAWWPDPLLPNRSFTVKSGTVQPVYLRFYGPRETKPGAYQGTVTVKTSSGAAEIPVHLRVRAVTMPVRLHVKTMLVGGKGGKPEEKPYLDLALEQRMGNGTLYRGMSWSKFNFPVKGGSFDFSGVEKKLQYALERGLNAFALASTPKSGKWGFPKNYSPGWKSKMSRVLREYGKWLKKKGWLKYAYYNNIDEPWSNRWGQVKEIYAMAKAANPEVKVFSCVNKIGALDALKGRADTFDVYIQQYAQQQAAARQKEGAEIWWAVCVWPDEHPNLFVEYPLLDARIIGWLTFQYRVAGFEYWDYTSWKRAFRKRGGKVPANGAWITCPGGVLTTAWPFDNNRLSDGYLCYPGPGGKPVNSLRFEALRDGFEDHELLCQLQRKLPSLSGAAKAEAEKLLRGEGIARNMFVYTQDPSRLLKARRRVLQLLSESGGK